MIREINRRIDILKLDCMNHAKDNYETLFADFKNDLSEILTRTNETSFEDTLLNLLRVCCDNFGVNMKKVMTTRRANEAMTKALTAYVVLATRRFDNKNLPLKLVNKSKIYYYHVMSRFENMYEFDKNFARIFNKIEDETRDIETDRGK